MFRLFLFLLDIGVNSPMTIGTKYNAFSHLTEDNSLTAAISHQCGNIICLIFVRMMKVQTDSIGLTTLLALMPGAHG